ncbi:MAG: DUF2723 domain-containing protein [Gemmatimonadota bacterium]|nr:DUF2723 domain-containing protein [Gemmatimonadota bacterium]MDE2984036.1 DUF2723 domain-containing protein [Gemmatimonadota bacterium]
MRPHTQTPRSTPDGSPPYGWAAAAAAAVGLLYAVTLAPTTAFWDTSEYIATAHIMGIPHPPGNPLFIILARTWDILLGIFGLSTAVKINLFSALMGALSHGLWFLVVHHILKHFSDDRRFRLIGAFAAVLVSATAFTVWNQSNVNEKVYTVSLLTIALLSWLAFRWQERIGKAGDDNLLVLMAFVLALSVGNHLMAFLAAPALLLFVLLVRPRCLLNPRLYLFGAPAIVLGLSVHLFLPIRSDLGPIINEAQPTCESIGAAVASVVTYGNAGCEDLSDALARKQYDKPPLTTRQAPLVSQAGNWLQYFDWQWARALSPTDVLFGRARIPLTALFIGLGIFGLLEHYRRDRVSWVYMISLFGVLSAGLVYYLNFKYGYSMPLPEENELRQLMEEKNARTTMDLREVRERDYFFVVGFSVWGLMAGIGIATLWDRVTRMSGRSLAATSPVLGLALIPLVLNFGWAGRAGDHTARDWAYNLLMSVEPYGVLFTNGDNDTFPLWYVQEVEGIRRDVTVAVTSYLNTPWYVKQLRDLTRPCQPGQDPDADPTLILCQRPYTAENTDAMYTHDPAEAEAAGKLPILLAEPVRVPSRGMFRDDLSDATVEQVAGLYPLLQESQSYNLGPLTATLAGGQNLFPWHQFTLAAIANSLGDRPVYFASAVTPAATFDIMRHIVRQGLAFRLWPDNPEEIGPAVLPNQDSTENRLVLGAWVDIARTRLLADSVFEHHSGIPGEWDYWPDRSTRGIPNYYSWMYQALGLDRGLRADPEAWARLEALRRAWVDLANSLEPASRPEQ